MQKRYKRILLLGALIILPFIVLITGVFSLAGYVAFTGEPISYLAPGIGLTVSPYEPNAMPGQSFGNGAGSSKEYVVTGSSGAHWLFCNSYDYQGIQIGSVDLRYWECR
jgi:hypothetical protein